MDPLQNLGVLEDFRWVRGGDAARGLGVQDPVLESEFLPERPYRGNA